MKRPIVVVTRKLPPVVESRLIADYVPRLNPDDLQLSRESLLESAVGADALLITITDRFDTELIQKLPRSVKIISTFSAGCDHIDMKAARERGIVVTNVPDVLTAATAEVAILLMLGAARRASEGELVMRSGNWPGWSPTYMLGRQLSGKRLGIVGFGRIGEATARIAKGLGLEILYHSRRSSSAAEQLGARYFADLDEMLENSEVLSLHCPSTPSTIGLLSTDRIAKLPRGAIVVNTARGDLIDDAALINALETGSVGAAGLDVYNGEPAIHPGYRLLPNTFLLPHLGSATIETRQAMGMRAIDNLDTFFSNNHCNHAA
ncbi:D-glycerate dehydrogenase [Polaromonas sp.]|uniref:2-hydroxyacid dehydrogenase n=1 Tax=Polaromonas sp. TaxID=1869339 RepID=UPI0032641051